MTAIATLATDLQAYADALATLADLAARTVDTDPDLPTDLDVVCENPFTWHA